MEFQNFAGRENTIRNLFPEAALGESNTMYSADGYEELEPPEKQEPEWPACVIRELDPAKEKWDMVVVTGILYSAINVPFRLCFRAEAEGNLWAFEASLSMVFLADLVLSFNTAYLQDGEYVSSRAAIAARYLKGWFWIDAPSSIPVEII